MAWRSRVLICSMLVSPISCAKPEAEGPQAITSSVPSATAKPRAITSSVASATASSSAANACVVSEPIEATEPEDTEGGSPGSQLHHFYTNADRTIWMFGGIALVPGKPAKVAWFRPPGAQLEVSGRRLDAPGPPLLFDVAPGTAYPHRFTPSGMTFPTDGCWEIVAKAGASVLSFVIRVPKTKDRGARD